MKDEYKEPITYTYPNATIRVHFPVLSDQERATRLKAIYAASANILKERR